MLYHTNFLIHKFFTHIFHFFLDRMKKNCMRTTATQTDRSRNSATITSPNSVGIPLQKSQTQSQFPQKVSNSFMVFGSFLFAHAVVCEKLKQDSCFN